MMMNLRGFGIAFLASLLLVPIVLVPEAEARPTCMGRRATHVGTAGDDVIRGTRRDDVIVARGGADLIAGRRGNDRICAGGGDDVVAPGGGRDRVSAASGADFLFYGAAPSSVTVNLVSQSTTGEGTDRFSGVEHVAGSESPDSITGDDGPNILFGEGGNDVIQGGDHIDLITGDEGDDNITGGEGFDIMSYSFSPAAIEADLNTGVATGEGTDSLTGVEGLQGSPFNDVLRGDAFDNFLFGEPGDDRLEGRGGHDSAVYWFAPAAITADLGSGTATGDGTDTLVDLEGVLGTVAFGDTLTGDDGNNYLDGDAGSDVISGGGGDDWLVPGPGDDQIEGGAGAYDVADFYATDPFTADLTAGTATGEGSDTLAGIEGLGGTDNPDVLIGDAGVNFLMGFGGNDQIQAAAGDDFVDGGSGDDTVDGGEGADNCVSAELSAAGCEGAAEFPVHPLLAYSLQAENLRNLRAPRQ